MFIDVIGRLKAIQPVEKVLVRGQELEDKREFILENIRFVKDSFFFNGM
jgi:replication factor A1